jgi:integrase
MASVHKDPRSKYWIAAFTDANGRRLKKSTKTTDKRLARRTAELLEEGARKRKTALQLRRLTAEISREYLGMDLKELTVREHVATWMNAKKPEVALSTLKFYEHATNRFLDWLGERADKELSLLARTDVVTFRNERSAGEVAAKTVNHEIKVLRMLFRSARKDGLITDDPAEFVELVRDRKAEAVRKPFTVEQLRAVLAECNDEWKSLVLFGLYTGQRLGDLVALRWSALDLTAGTVRFVTQKTGKRLILPLSEPLLRHVMALPVGDGPEAPVHPRAFGSLERTGKTGGLSNQFADILAAAGLREKKPHRSTGKGREAGRERSGLSFHSLRHTAVSLLKDAGIPAASVMEFIGHDSEQMSQHYTHVGIEQLSKAAASLPDITQ